MNDKNEKDLIANWLKNAIAQQKRSVPDVAKKAGIAPSTLYRTLNADAPETLSSRSLMKVAEALQVNPPTLQEKSEGFSESEVNLYIPPQKEETKQSHQPRLTQFEISSRALELAGILPGDVITFDQNLLPQTGDIVVAQMYNLERGSAETVIRQYEAPYLTCATLEKRREYSPAVVDNKNVLILGTMVELLRKRHF